MRVKAATLGVTWALAAIVCALAAGAGVQDDGIAIRRQRANPEPAGPIPPVSRCAAPGALDQDDMCVWIDRADPARSTIITSDKAAGAVFVYGLDGQVRQTIRTPKPGNIDCRPGFPLAGATVDLVVHNQRQDGFRLLAYAVDGQSRRLRRVDDGQITTGENYGGTLFRSPKSGRFYFVSTSETGSLEQYELSDDGAGRVRGRKVRQWAIGKCEAAVADDRTGTVYVGEEARGVWAVSGEPDGDTPGRLVIRVGEHGLEGDVEGLALVPERAGGPLLVVSDQGAECFRVYDCGQDYAFIGAFRVTGAGETDGIETALVDFGPRFPAGLFACHTDQGSRPVLVARWDVIAGVLAQPRPAGE